jgi:hypothetical protein
MAKKHKRRQNNKNGFLDFTVVTVTVIHRSCSCCCCGSNATRVVTTATRMRGTYKETSDRVLVSITEMQTKYGVHDNLHLFFVVRSVNFADKDPQDHVPMKISGGIHESRKHSFGKTTSNRWTDRSNVTSYCLDELTKSQVRLPK